MYFCPVRRLIPQDVPTCRRRKTRLFTGRFPCRTNKPVSAFLRFQLIQLIQPRPPEKPRVFYTLHKLQKPPFYRVRKVRKTPFYKGSKNSENTLFIRGLLILKIQGPAPPVFRVRWDCQDPPRLRSRPQPPTVPHTVVNVLFRPCGEHLNRTGL